jgi:NAD+ kinase
MKIAVFINEHKPNNDIDKLIIGEAVSHGLIIDNKNPDIVIFVGGDGTFLRAVHHYLPIIESVKFLGVGAGNLGFFYDFHPEDVHQLFTLLEEHELKETSHHLLEGQILTENGIETIYAVNEIRLENPFHTLICDVEINYETLETYRGNGLVVSSSLGSSAYNKSLGGSLIDHSLDLLELTEIATIQNNINRSLGASLVVSGDSKITFCGNFKEALIGYDNVVIDQHDVIRLEVYRSSKIVRLLHSPDYQYIKSLRRSFIK